MIFPRLFIFIAPALLLVLWFGPETARAQHDGDIYIEDQDGVIVTGALDPDAGNTAPAHVFTGTFNAGGFTSNPGFDTTPPMFAPGTRIGLNFLDTLRIWNGCGFEETDDEFLRLSFSIATADSGPCLAPGFDLAVDSGGGYHKHYTFNVRSDGTGDGVVEPGIYLVMLELYSTDPALASSDPFWLVLNFQDAPANLDAAFTWADNRLAAPPPCPSDCAPDNGDGTSGNGIVNIDDLLAVVSAFNTPDTPDTSQSPCDVAPANCDGGFGNGAVNIDDLLTVISDFGRVCDAVIIPPCAQ